MVVELATGADETWDRRTLTKGEVHASKEARCCEARQEEGCIQEAQAECRVHEAADSVRTSLEVVGGKAIPRTEVTKKLWAYIKKNKLQDKTKRTMINADDKLRAVFGGKRQVSMFEMTKLVSKHLK
jgi:hypothetical protein